MLTLHPLAVAVGLSVAGQGLAFNLVREYSGTSFFDKWDFYGSWDNLTLGDVWWLNATEAALERLAYVNDAGHAILKVDNTTNVPFNDKRNSVRITTQDFYDYGSLWIIDLLHIPYGCSVWPAFWTKGPTWPDDGEIDIIESINLHPNNQMALHTTGGCMKSATAAQTGQNVGLDCSTGSGCVVIENTPNSYQAGFAAAGGGVWATQFDVTGIYIWFWSRANVPASITQATSTSSLDISQWGTPSASYPVNPQCGNLTEFFTAQQLVLDITLCGDWAGVPPIYSTDCANQGPTGQCYQDNVVGAGSPKYDNAFFEISYVRAYTAGSAAPSTLAPSGTTVLASPTGGADATGSGASTTTVTDGPPDPTIVTGAASGAQTRSASVSVLATLMTCTTAMIFLGSWLV